MARSIDGEETHSLSRSYAYWPAMGVAAPSMAVGGGGWWVSATAALALGFPAWSSFGGAAACVVADCWGGGCW